MPREREKETLHNQVIRLESLPTLPAVAVELIRRWNDPDLTVASIVELLSYDSSLSAKVLQVANSASYRFQREITTLKHAATLLGLNTLRCVTLGVTVFECFADHKTKWAGKMDLDEFWRHCLAVGTAAEMLARRYQLEAPEEYFLAGLLHDIGKIGFLAAKPDEYVEVLEKASAGDKTLLAYEDQILSVTHSDVGKWIAEKWELPERFQKAIWKHHQPPGTNAIRSDDPAKLEKVVHLADHLARRARIGNGGNQHFEHDETWLNRRFGFETEDLSEFTSELLVRVQNVAEHLDLSVPTIQVYLKAINDANRLLAAHGLEAEEELREVKEHSEFLKTLSEIADLPSHTETGVDLLSQAVDRIRTYLDLRWMLLVTNDSARGTVQGVLFTEAMKTPQTFYRVLNVVEKKEEGTEERGTHTVELLGETILTNGRRINLRDEVLKVLQSGNLLAIPLTIDSTCSGECLVDATGSKVQYARHREHLGSLLDATGRLFERARLYRNLQRETELASEALQRESEALRQLFHFERLASVGRLAAGAAHEINNPLAVISGKAQLLLMGEEDSTRVEALNSIIDQTMRISKIISDLMGYARPAEPEVGENDLRAMIENALYMAEHRLPDSNVETEIEIPDSIRTLRVDARQIEQVLVNLFVNALQAMEGDGKLTVRAEYVESTGMVAVHVADTGPGIPPEDISRVFDPFFTTKREGEGTGLGLAVSHRIIESHGGRMTVTSHLGRGTTFTVQIPAAPEEEEDAEVVRMPQASHKTARRGGKRRILLVDDEKQLSDLIRDFLQAAGYVVEQASDGIEAMSLLETQVYDALILDIRMPRKDGLEVLQELKKMTTGLPFMVITGLASNEEIDQATAFGAERILRKPFQLDELLHAVDEITKKRSANGQ